MIFTQSSPMAGQSTRKGVSIASLCEAFASSRLCVQLFAVAHYTAFVQGNRFQDASSFLIRSNEGLVLQSSRTKPPFRIKGRKSEKSYQLIVLM